MCGIIGYVGHRRCHDVLLEGLRRLEYRGYDSAGVAWRGEDRTECVRAVGNLDALSTVLATRVARVERERASVSVAETSCGIGHTRWATHGAVTEDNAHPHTDATGRIRVVLNGIIENYLDIRAALAAYGIACQSETDAEVVAHLISRHYDGDLAHAVRQAMGALAGHYAFVVMCDDEPQTLVAARHECPLVIGLGDGEHFVASSVSAFLARTRRLAVLHDREVAVIRQDAVTVFDVDGLPHQPGAVNVDWDEDQAEKQGFETFMLKEIQEQPEAVAQTLSRWRADMRSGAHEMLHPESLAGVRRIMMVGCGTSYHAGLAGRIAIERWARLPVEVEVASEFRYREPIFGPGTIVVGITQSGETADTLAAMRLARRQGVPVVAVTNVAGSQATREADCILLTRAGLEMGVAATKTFITQVALLYALALRLAEIRATMPSEQLKQIGMELDGLPEHLRAVLRSAGDGVRELAERLAWSPFFLYLGRLSGFPVVLEGALKLKEISYVPTDAYPAGEMKHGPIALLSEDTPVVCVATEHSVLPKLMSNLSEVRARGARVLAIAGEGDKEIAEHAEHIVYVPQTESLLQAALAVVPLQLFAYYLARGRGLNVDQPRNLAKTVTVE